MQVYAAKHAGGVPEVWLIRESLPPKVDQWQLTPGEAQQLVEALQLVLGQIGATA